MQGGAIYTLLNTNTHILKSYNKRMFNIQEISCLAFYSIFFFKYLDTYLFCLYTIQENKLFFAQI